jgi:hypothetical protein
MAAMSDVPSVTLCATLDALPPDRVPVLAEHATKRRVAHDAMDLATGLLTVIRTFVCDGKGSRQWMVHCAAGRGK